LGLSCWPDRQTNQTDQTNQIDQMNQFTSPLSCLSRVKETTVAATALFFAYSLPGKQRKRSHFWLLTPFSELRLH
jgi:hypothetical protein